jgi:large subunit ribosomal protein L16
MTKRVADMRGPELVHNKLIHKQYAIVALSGGQMEYGHFNMIRNTINFNFDMTKTFALWRVDPPWKPITRHGQGFCLEKILCLKKINFHKLIIGKKLGGGKGPISHYTTPVKRGRIIIEVGGSLPLEFLYRTLIDVAQKLPFPAKVISQKDLEQWEKNDEDIRKNNQNKLTWEWCIKNNTLNVLNYVGKYDIEYSHMGPNCR